MDILRRFGLFIAVLLLSFSLSAVALSISLYAVFETPDSLKRALNDSGIYTISPQDTLASDETAATALPATDPGIQQALASALPPSFVQDSSNQAIDGIYNWAHGTTQSPDFSIDLSQVKVNFANNVATYIEQKVTALPPCTQFVMPPETIDGLLEMTCRPIGVSTADIGSRARQVALNSNAFSENNTIDTGSFKDAEGKPLSEQLSFIPIVHQYFIIALYILPVITLLCMLAIIFWSLTKRAGVKRVAWILVTIGITNAIFAVLQIWFLQAAVSILGTPESMAIQEKLLVVIELLAVELRNWWLGFSIGYIVLGIILFIGLAVIRPKSRLAMGQEEGGHQSPPPSNLPNLS